MRTAIVGTSHVNAIRAAVDSDLGRDLAGEDAFFFALNAPILSKENSLGWAGDPGTMCCRTDVGRAFLNRVFLEPGLAFDPAKFDRILLVDFFFCYDFVFLLRDRQTDAVYTEGQLISHALFKEMIAMRLGKSQYQESSAVGKVEENSILPLLSNMRDRAPNAKIFMTPRPIQPAGNKASLAIGLSSQEIQKCLGLFDSAATDILAQMNISWCPQPTQTFDVDTGLTADAYSIGPHATLPERMDEHLNADYGLHVLADVAKMGERVDE